MSGKEHNETQRDLKRIVCGSGIFIVALVGVMVFSPLALQYGEAGTMRGDASMADFDSLMVEHSYSCALHWVDSCIEEKERDLPRVAYFDRFLSEEERYKASINRADIYDLQWTRIAILKEMDDKEALKDALEDYIGIIGYNQEQAKAMLNQVKGGAR